MATSRMTLGAILSAASETAATVTTTMNTINATVNMANTFVNKAADNQRIRYAMEAVGTKHAIATEIAMEMQQRNDAINDYLNGDAERTKEFNDNLQMLLAACAD